MTQERINTIAKMLNEDEARAKKLMEMSADKAAEAMKAEGFDVTAEELVELNKLMTEIAKNGEPEEEIDEKSLDEVAGGYGYYYGGYYGYRYYYYYYPTYYRCCCYCRCYWY